jgi:hypothetical protein
MMGDLEKLELILRRIVSKRERDHKDGKTVLNIDTQDLLLEVCDEIALATVKTPPKPIPY